MPLGTCVSEALGCDSANLAPSWMAAQSMNLFSGFQDHLGPTNDDLLSQASKGQQALIFAGKFIFTTNSIFTAKHLLLHDCLYVLRLLETFLCVWGQLFLTPRLVGAQVLTLRFMALGKSRKNSSIYAHSM